MDNYSLDSIKKDIMMNINLIDGEEYRNRTEKSFFVSKDEIVQNDYDLSINKYKEVIVEQKHYDEPKVIFERIKAMEVELQQRLNELEGIL